MIAVVIPAYKVKKHILNVIHNIGSAIDIIYVVDDKCPEKTGDFVRSSCSDKRVQVLYNAQNLGVGGTMVTGYKQALKDKVKVVIKIDGDDQMNSSLIPSFISPIINNEADYTKGNRFFHIEGLEGMPIIRIIGNAGLSFINKAVSGYWSVMDPTNGFTAISASALREIPLEKLAKRYFFESDMLFRLNVARCVIKDIPMNSKYADEESNLSIKKVLITFPPMYINRFLKRIFYNYFLRDFNIGSIALVSSTFLILFGLIYGSFHWISHHLNRTTTPTGTIMLSVLPLILGFQTFLFFLQQDISSSPKTVLSKVD